MVYRFHSDTLLSEKQLHFGSRSSGGFDLALHRSSKQTHHLWWMIDVRKNVGLLESDLVWIFSMFGLLPGGTVKGDSNIIEYAVST